MVNFAPLENSGGSGDELGNNFADDEALSVLMWKEQVRNSATEKDMVEAFKCYARQSGKGFTASLRDWCDERVQRGVEIPISLEAYRWTVKHTRNRNLGTNLPEELSVYYQAYLSERGLPKLSAGEPMLFRE